MSLKTVFNLQQEGAPMDLVVILKSKWNPQYWEARKISNAKFDYYPSGVAYCKNVSHVQYCINFCRENNILFRVRSGGHHHEGMCSGDNLLVIALSEINEIEYTKDEDGEYGDEAWIPVGKQLQKVYGELEKRDQVIPGGVCQSVNVGGLTHGGGWGVSIRKYGMTCDNVIEAEMVLADGRIVYPSATNLPDLFWGLKGGGGGNFGIVTRFKFKLRTLLSAKQSVVTTFTCNWKNPKDTLAVIGCWLKMQRDKTLTRNLSTSCMMIIAPSETKNCSVKIRMGGLFYGQSTELVNLLTKYFAPNLFSDAKAEITLLERFFVPKSEAERKQMDKSLKSPIGILQNIGKESSNSFVGEQAMLSDFLNPTIDSVELPGLQADRYYEGLSDKGMPDAPRNSCAGYYPHKVTSGFPKVGIDDAELAQKIYNYLASTRYRQDSNRYMGFHCMGGAVEDHPEQRAFPWFDRPYVLKAQAWWSPSGKVEKDAELAKAYDKWINGFRKSLEPHIEGAFINFINKDLVEDATTPEGKLALLRFYYGDKLPKLRAVKSEYDKGNLFDFGMSIPPSEKR